jgi:hypothetical protein
MVFCRCGSSRSPDKSLARYRSKFGVR